MYPAFRWFGPSDPIPLNHIRQIPGVKDIVGSLFEIPVGAVWPLETIRDLKQTVEDAGLRLSVIESIPVHENIKLGRNDRDTLIENYCLSVRNMGTLGIPVLCYNFMPVFDWVRTDLAHEQKDGATVLEYDEDQLAGLDLSSGTPDMPAWVRYSAAELQELLEAYRQITTEQLWENLAYFLERVIPVAESAGVKMAIHPDDPPWSVFGLPRIINGHGGLQHLIDIVDSPSNGITLCTGSLGADPDFDVVTAAHEFGRQDRINFVHLRNVKHESRTRFHESPHPSAHGELDMHAIMKTLHRQDYSGPLRPDHGRMIWDEKGIPGYGLYDRALGLMYLQGLWEAIEKDSSSTDRAGG